MPDPDGGDPTGRPAQPGDHLLARDFDHETLVAVRHQVQRCAEQNGLSGLELYRFVVAVNEITTNAVRHGGGTGRLELWRSDNRLYCQVTDRGPGLPAGHPKGEHRPPLDAISGRGLWLARQSAETLTMHSGTNGTSVTVTGQARAFGEARVDGS
jgi:anti-sigma regulatory factor (Ser/Thr protein kinase)